jgi:hypothetical protein
VEKARIGNAVNRNNMFVKQHDFKTVFIMGAGATRGALPHVVVNRKRIRPPLNGDFFRVAKTYARAKGKESIDARRVERLLRVFKSEIPYKGEPTMEEAFSLLYVAKDFPDIYGVRIGRKRKAGNQREIEDFLKLTFGILLTIGRESEGETGYDRLVSKLGSNDTIITLNYDTLLDSALCRSGWNPKLGYGLRGGRRKVIWDPRRGDDPSDAARVKLLKLHGSVNWYVRGSYSNLSRVFSSKPVVVSGPRQNEIREHIRQIIPPIFGKVFEHEHWRSLWTKAYKELCSAEVLVVIGCSLIDTDFHLRALISRAVRHRKATIDLLKQTILVAGTKARRKWQKALKGSYRKVKGYPSLDQFLTKELKT